MTPVLLLNQIKPDQLSLVGQRYLDIGRLSEKGVPFPPSFAITGEGFLYCLHMSGVKDSIAKALKSKFLNRRRIERLVSDMPLPPIVEASIRNII